METIAIYLLKMLICSGLLLAYYRVALYNGRFHSWNRFYLLSAMVLSVIVPVINIPLFTQQPQVATVVNAMPWNVVVKAGNASAGFNWQNAIGVVIVLASLALFIRIVRSVLKLVSAYRKQPVITIGNNVSLIVTNEQNAPYSFFNWLYWRQDIDPDSVTGQRILTHEFAHIQERHSYDKFFVELLLCVFWMNPFFWLMRRELSMVHEFLADSKAIKRHDGAAFAEMILAAMNMKPASSLTSAFFSSQIKRRLVMITTTSKPNYTRLRQVLALAIIPFTVLLVACSTKSEELLANSSDNKTIQAEGSIQVAYFPGKREAWLKLLQTNLQYPVKAQENNTQGRATIEFLVAKDGSLSDFKILVNPGDGLGEEAQRIIQSGPKWIPAVQDGEAVTSKVTQNVTFLLQ